MQPRYSRLIKLANSFYGVRSDNIDDELIKTTITARRGYLFVERDARGDANK